MPGTRYVEVPYAGHGPTRSMPECGAQVMRDFFDNRDLESLDATCLEEGAGAPQYEDLVWSTAVHRALALAPDAPQSFIVPMLWAGACVLILFLGVFILPLSVLARIIDRRPAAELAALTGGARLTARLAAVSGLAGLTLIGVGAARLMEDADAAIIAGLAAPAGRDLADAGDRCTGSGEPGPAGAYAGVGRAGAVRHAGGDHADGPRRSGADHIRLRLGSRAVLGAAHAFYSGRLSAQS